MAEVPAVPEPPAAPEPVPAPPVPVENLVPPIPEAPVTGPSATLEMVEDEVEEVYEDIDYVFDPEAGPAAPSWPPWSPSQRDEVEAAIKANLAPCQQKVKPAYLIAEVRRFLAGKRSGYFLVSGGQGVGKTLLARSILRAADELSGNPLKVLGRFLCEIQEAADDRELFLESINRKAHSALVPRAHRVSPLDTQTVRDLTQRVGNHDPESRFREYMADLARLNRSTILLVIDGLDEKTALSLSRKLPDNVFAVLLYDPSGQTQATTERLQQLQEVESFTIDTSSPNYSALLEEALQAQPSASGLSAQMRASLFQKMERKLAWVRLGSDLAGAGLPVESQPGPDGLYQALVNQAASPDFPVEKVASLLLSVSASPGAVSLDDLDQWGGSPQALKRLLKTFPSAFYLDNTGLCPALGLAHETFGAFLAKTYPGQLTSLWKILTGWAVHALLAANDERLQSAQTREWARFNFVRVFAWSLQAHDRVVLEWVVRCKELQRKRIALAGALEKAGFYHQKIEILNLWETCLKSLVEEHGVKDLRDEWAWALSSRALSFIKLANHRRALTDVEKAITLFTTLVEGEGQTQFLNGLAAAHNRRSEIYSQLKEPENALADARKAVELYRDLVEDRGRDDLRYLLAMAYHNRATVQRILKVFDEASKDCDKACQLYTKLMEKEGGETHKQRLATVCNTWGLVYLSLDQLDEAITLSAKAVRFFNELVEQGARGDLKNELAAAHNNRGSAYHRKSEFERAQRDYGKAIALRSQLIDEGRLDLRDDLALTYTNRAIVNYSLNHPQEVIRDYSKAIQLRQQLVDQEGKLEQKSDLASNHLYRGMVNQAASQLDAALGDFDQAVRLFTDFFKSQGQNVQELALAFNNKTAVHLAQGDVPEALQASKTLVSLISGVEGVPAEALATAYRHQGQGLHSQGMFREAEQSYSEAVNLMTRLIESEGRLDLLGELAISLRRRAEVSLATGNIDSALADSGKSIEALSVLIEKSQRRDLFSELGAAYSLRGRARIESESYQESMEDLGQAFKLFEYLSSQHDESIAEEFGKAYRHRAEALMHLGENQAALNDSNEAMRLLLVTRQQNQRGPWLDELARTWVIRGGIFYNVKDFGQADNQLNDAVEHFQKKLNDGRYEYFHDMAKALQQRATNSQKGGKVDKVIEELTKIVTLAENTMLNAPQTDLYQVIGSTYRRRAHVYQDQGLFQEAYQDYEKSLSLFKKLVGEDERYELAPELATTYLDRARMLDSAGHPEPSINDYTESINICRALMSQGNTTLTKMMSASLVERARALKVTGRIPQAAEDIAGAISLQMQLARTAATPKLWAELGGSLLLQGSLYQAAGQINEAAQSYDKGIQLYTSLVEGQGLKEYSGELAQCLMARTSLAGGGAARDPHTLNVLTKAVQLVTQQAREGLPVPRDFSLDCLQSVVELVNNQGSDAAPDLIDSVLKLLEVVVANSKSQGQDFVKMTDLLLAASAGLADDRRSSRRAHFLSLACVSCNREIQVFGKNSLPRLVYCLYELGQALERSKPPEALAYVGGSFGLLLDLIGRYQGSEDFKRELKMMVSTWRSLPPAVPALANVSRHTLSQLLKIT